MQHKRCELLVDEHEHATPCCPGLGAHGVVVAARVGMYLRRHRRDWSDARNIAIVAESLARGVAEGP